LLMKRLVVILIACPCRSWRLCECVCAWECDCLCARVLGVIYAKLQILLVLTYAEENIGHQKSI